VPCHCEVVRVPPAGAEGLGFKRHLEHWIFQTLSVHSAVNEYFTLFKSEEGEGGEEEEWCPTSVTPFPVQVGHANNEGSNFSMGAVELN